METIEKGKNEQVDIRDVIKTTEVKTFATRLNNSSEISTCTVKRLTYGYELIPTHCYKHKKQNMKLIKFSCINNCNIATLNYNFPNLRYGTRCNKHKEDGMINIMKIKVNKEHQETNQSSRNWPKRQPSKWLLDRIHLSDLEGFDVESYHEEVVNLPYINNHVGGSGKSSPPRGVCVIGGKDKIEKTWWTASQNTNNITLESETVFYPEKIKPLIPILIEKLKEKFPNAPISEATFALAVANKYNVGTKNKIAPHTDDQPWYASPPVFASVTTFPNGEPEDYRATFRFQVLDEGFDIPTYVDLFLHHSSICLMRADVTHRVLPPLLKFKNHKVRCNLTFRNLVSQESDPLGFVMAMSNHYRYYGNPSRMIIPNNVKTPELLVQRYKTINPEFKIVRKEVSKTAKNEMRIKVAESYSKRGLILNSKMMLKSNVTLDCLIWAFEKLNLV